ncbi:MAG: hypothetical protein ACOCU6_03480 [Nanoarchaeota archaeon]
MKWKNVIDTFLKQEYKELKRYEKIKNKIPERDKNRVREAMYMADEFGEYQSLEANIEKEPQKIYRIILEEEKKIRNKIKEKKQTIAAGLITGTVILLMQGMYNLIKSLLVGNSLNSLIITSIIFLGITIILVIIIIRFINNIENERNKLYQK